MQKEMFISVVLGAVLCTGACSHSQEQVSAATPHAASLTGTVTSAAEGSMEGVLVRAKPEGGTITVTVVSDSQGRYAFPEGRLKAGKYRVGIRAAGYDLEDPGVVDVTSNRTAEVDLTLTKTADLPPQLMNAEWFMSIEGTPEQKTGLEVRLDLLDKDRCSMCHSVWFLTRNGRDQHDWLSTLNRMRFHTMGSTPINPDDHPRSPRLKKFWGPAGGGATDSSWDDETGVGIPDRVTEQAAWLATINLSADPLGTWKYPLRTLPRPKGDETKVIITEYDLPRPVSQPHDAVVDPEGMIWYQDFGHNDTGHFIGRLDPHTGQVKEWRVAAFRQNPPFTGGGLDLRIDRNGNPWFALLKQGAVLRFDKRTEQMTFWSVPNPTLNSLVTMLAFSPNGEMLWFAESGGGMKIHGLDLKTGWITRTLQGPSMYAMAPLPNGNLVHFDFGGSAVHELDTKTGKTTTYPTPTPSSAPRRGHVDAQGRAWFGEYQGGKIAMFDSNTKEIKEWAMPVPYADPYDVILDRNEEAWGGGMVTDYVFRLNPATGKVTKYLLPTVNANIRRIDVDNSTTPVSVWVGENHHAKIARIEVLGGR